MLTGDVIWDLSRIPDRARTRIEFPDLLRFRDHWYCAFREGEIHNNHPSGRGRVIRSADGRRWETAALFRWDSGDVREPKLSITAEGWLMVNTSVYFVSREPRRGPGTGRADERFTHIPREARRADDRDLYYQLDWLGTTLNLPDHDREPAVTQQSVTWLSPDGLTWSGAYACPTGINTWRWDCTWHNGMGYSIAQWGKEKGGTLYRTRDGKSWRALRTDFFPEGHGGEGALAFGADDTAYCLLRGDSRHGAFLGIGRPPYYQDWTWKQPLVDYGPAHGGPRPIGEMFGTGLGGPNHIRLRDGRLIGAGRALGPGRDDGHATLFRVDPEAGVLTMLAECDGTSYPGLAEHDGRIWITYIDRACHQDIWQVRLASLNPEPDLKHLSANQT